MTSAPRWSAAAAAVAEIAGSTWTAPRPDRQLSVYLFREARDANAELAVDVDDLAVGPDLAADAQRDARPFLPHRQHGARREAKQLVAAQRDSPDLCDDFDRRSGQDGGRIRVRSECRNAHVPLLVGSGENPPPIESLPSTSIVTSAA
jgi:hypothetical protein